MATVTVNGEKIKVLASHANVLRKIWYLVGKGDTFTYSQEDHTNHRLHSNMCSFGLVTRQLVHIPLAGGFLVKWSLVLTVRGAVICTALFGAHTVVEAIKQDEVVAEDAEFGNGRIYPVDAVIITDTPTFPGRDLHNRLFDPAIITMESYYEPDQVPAVRERIAALFNGENTVYEIAKYLDTVRQSGYDDRSYTFLVDLMEIAREAAAEWVVSAIDEQNR